MSIICLHAEIWGWDLPVGNKSTQLRSLVPGNIQKFPERNWNFICKKKDHPYQDRICDYSDHPQFKWMMILLKCILLYGQYLNSISSNMFHLLPLSSLRALRYRNVKAGDVFHLHFPGIPTDLITHPYFFIFFLISAVLVPQNVSHYLHVLTVTKETAGHVNLLSFSFKFIT